MSPDGCEEGVLWHNFLTNREPVLEKTTIEGGHRSGDLPAGPKVDSLPCFSWRRASGPHQPSVSFNRFARALLNRSFEFSSVPHEHG